MLRQAAAERAEACRVVLNVGICSAKTKMNSGKLQRLALGHRLLRPASVLEVGVDVLPLEAVHSADLNSAPGRIWSKR